MSDERIKALEDELKQPGPHGQRYRHYKGGLYLAIGISTDEGTGAKYVVYVSEANGKMWHRPIDDFFGTVPGPDGNAIPRFREEPVP